MIHDKKTNREKRTTPLLYGHGKLEEINLPDTRRSESPFLDPLQTNFVNGRSLIFCSLQGDRRQPFIFPAQLRPAPLRNPDQVLGFFRIREEIIINLHPETDICGLLQSMREGADLRLIEIPRIVSWLVIPKQRP